ncbi:hypothetical protein EPA93_10570 [Ktedonosporobacter rubrisoli]|uniref:BFN domain-containing protein n=1 Tax=Ktedonosporobacter rubrisoli TaxID=2509675 RepID=A0A4P6JME8_KTERU|nr:bifunctional nuclease domain-containing protein [Ktedonosporobacter rubrisoli]QBD76429.1 hypothetical protein EPA93_10570 [Ktedonosporobacter rubrisoli]
MIPVTLAKTEAQENIGWIVTYVLLLDAQGQRVLPLWFYQTDTMSRDLPLQTSLQKDLTATTLARPLTLDLLTRLLKTLKGTLEGIIIDFLQGEVLSAQITIQDQQGRQHNVPASLNDALALAVSLNCSLLVSETALEKRGVTLAEYGTDLQQQLETVFRLLQNSPEQLTLKKEPHNLDFSDGLYGWLFLGNPEQVDYHLDTETTGSGKASLSIELHDAQPDTSTKEKSEVDVCIISHEGFLPVRYRGQQVRMLAILKTENVQQANLHLTVSGPPVESPRSTSGYRPNYLHEYNTTKNPIEGTRDWTSHELIIDVPADAYTITPYLVVEGEGKLWLDKIAFEIIAE